MAERVELLFDDFAVRWRRGERPDLRAYLRDAGGGADELAALVEAFLAAAPPPEPDAGAVALARAWAEGESPLLALRTARGVRRDEVVDALLGELGLAASLREKLRRRYHELESGLLEPRRVDRRVWEVLGARLRTGVDELARWSRPAERFPEGLAYYRATAAPPVAAQAPPRAAEPSEPDEVDRLFGVGP